MLELTVSYFLCYFGVLVTVVQSLLQLCHFCHHVLPPYFLIFNCVDCWISACDSFAGPWLKAPVVTDWTNFGAKHHKSRLTGNVAEGVTVRSKAEVAKKSIAAAFWSLSKFICRLSTISSSSFDRIFWAEVFSQMKIMKPSDRWTFKYCLRLCLSNYEPSFSN
jgi:hypothetical protein